MNTLKTMLVMAALCFTATTALAGENSPVKNSIVNIQPTAAHDALIIKTASACTVQVIDECGQIVFEQKVNKGVNEISLKKLAVASYKLLVSGSSFSVSRKLSVR